MNDEERANFIRISYQQTLDAIGLLTSSFQESDEPDQLDAMLRDPQFDHRPNVMGLINVCRRLLEHVEAKGGEPPIETLRRMALDIQRNLYG